MRAAPDGYTLLLTTSADTWNATLYDHLKFNFVRDVAPVASISRGPGVLVVHPSLAANSVPELIADAQRSPGKITVASAGIGSAPHMYWELFRSLSGVDMLHVPYRGGGPALTDLLGGQVQIPSGPQRPRLDMSGRESCALWRLPAQHAPRCCLTFRHWPNPCRATRLPSSSASPRLATRRSISSTD